MKKNIPEINKNTSDARAGILSIVNFYKDASPEDKKNLLSTLEQVAERNNRKGGKYLKLRDLWSNLSAELVANFGDAK